MGKVLDIELFRYENMLFGKVLEVNKILMDPNQDTKVLIYAPNMIIRTSTEVVSPCLGEVSLVLSDKCINRTFSHEYRSVEDAIVMSEEISECINIINNNFKDANNSDKCKCVGVIGKVEIDIVCE